MDKSAQIFPLFIKTDRWHNVNSKLANKPLQTLNFGCKQLDVHSSLAYAVHYGYIRLIFTVLLHKVLHIDDIITSGRCLLLWPLQDVKTTTQANNHY